MRAKYMLICYICYIWRTRHWSQPSEALFLASASRGRAMEDEDVARDDPPLRSDEATVRPPRRRRTSSPRWPRWRWTPTRTRRRSTRSCAASPPPPRARSTPSSRRRRSRSRPRGAGPSRRARARRASPPPSSDAKHPSETSGTSAPSPPRWRTTTAPSARSRTSARAWNASRERSTSSRTTPRWSAARWTEPPTNPIPGGHGRRGQRRRRSPRRRRLEREAAEYAAEIASRTEELERLDAEVARARRELIDAEHDVVFVDDDARSRGEEGGGRARSRLGSRCGHLADGRGGAASGTRRRVTRRTPGNGRGGRWWRSGSGSWSRPVAASRREAYKRVNEKLQFVREHLEAAASMDRERHVDDTRRLLELKHSTERAFEQVAARRGEE